jgi:predicted O-methyltransferase YrrM
MHEYVFDTEPGYSGDMSVAVQEAVRATLWDRVGTPLNLLEVGVWEGRGACWLLDNLLTHPDSRYVGVDAWVSPPGIPTVAGHNLALHGPKATLITGDSRLVVPHLQAVFDAAVVDGLHTFQGCYADLVNCWPKVRPGGVMIVDDYRYPGLEGVGQAVDHFARARGLTFAYNAMAVAFRKPERDDGTVPGT